MAAAAGVGLFYLSWVLFLKEACLALRAKQARTTTDIGFGNPVDGSAVPVARSHNTHREARRDHRIATGNRAPAGGRIGI